MQISFYVLNSAATSSSSPNEALLDFVCKLTQTVLKKSKLSLVIVDDDAERLAQLDERLWSFDPASFIPHARVSLSPSTSNKAIDESVGDPQPLLGGSSESDARGNHSSQIATCQDNTVELTAPVLLTAELPAGFDGAILNLAAKPLALPNANSDNTALSSAASPERVLEIIAPDEVSKQQGRDKYQHYKSQGFTLTYHPIN